MKKILILLLLTISISLSAQKPFHYNKLINGYWGDWMESTSMRSVSGPAFVLKGEYDNFIIYNEATHPSEYILKVTINGMTVQTNKKHKKIVLKSGNWYEYSGTVEYVVQNDSQSFKDIVSGWPFALYSKPQFRKYKTVSATIKVAPYKNNPEVYNIIVENSGLGINVN